MRGQEVIVL